MKIQTIHTHWARNIPESHKVLRSASFLEGEDERDSRTSPRDQSIVTGGSLEQNGPFPSPSTLEREGERETIAPGVFPMWPTKFSTAWIA